MGRGTWPWCLEGVQRSGEHNIYLHGLVVVYSFIVVGCWIRCCAL